MSKENRLFVACIFALVATSFGFIVRALLLNQLGQEFNLSESQKGAIQGAGLFPFALSIIFFSLIVDRIGYGRAMVFAWCAHVVSAIITITASNYTMLYIGTLIFALANGTIEAVANPVTATLFPHSKTKHLNMLHSGWAGGLVLGGLLAIALGGLGWRWKIGLFLLPTLFYGVLMLGRKFPQQERVTAGIPYSDMLKEFGWASCLIVCVFICFAIEEVCGVFNVHFLPQQNPFIFAVGYSLLPTLFFAFRFRSFGRPLFVFLLFVMILSATTELGTDSWITDLLTPAMQQLGVAAGWVLVYTSAIMLVLRLSAGPLVHKLSPLGVLMICSAITAAGLFWVAHAGVVAWAIFAAATLYGMGKAFFWPTMLGVVSEQFPKGGALTLNTIGGIGMISVGVLGAAFLGTLQDAALDRNLKQTDPAIYSEVTQAPQTKFAMQYRALDHEKINQLPDKDHQTVDKVIADTKQITIAKFALLPGIMFVCYAGLIVYFRMRGGYKPVHLTEAAPVTVHS